VLQLFYAPFSIAFLLLQKSNEFEDVRTMSSELSVGKVMVTLADVCCAISLAEAIPQVASKWRIWGHVCPLHAVVHLVTTYNIRGVGFGSLESLVDPQWWYKR
jgi:hypothetical protein